MPVLIKTMTGTAGNFSWTVPAGESGDRRIHGGNNYDGDFYSAPFSIVSAAQPPSGAPAFYQGPIGNKITSAACGTAFTFQVDGYSGSQVWLTQTKNGTTSYDSILNVPDTYTPVCNRDEGTYTETVYTVTNGQKGTLLGSTTFTVKSASSSLAPDQVSQTANILDAMRATLEQLYQAASR
jgi:hypothetical protein